MKKINLKFIAYFQFFYALVLVVFWFNFFTIEIHNPKNTEIFIAHEKSFPVPDLGYILPCLIIGSIGILKKKKYGFLFSILAGSASIFLALLDATFSIQQDILIRSLIDGIIYSIFIILLLFYGIYTIIVIWRRLLIISKNDP